MAAAVASALLRWFAVEDERRLYAPRFHLLSARRSGYLFMLYRLVCFGYLFATSVFIRASSTLPRYDAFLTNQGVWITNMYFFCACVVGLVALWRARKGEHTAAAAASAAAPAAPAASAGGSWPHTLLSLWWRGWKLATHVLFSLSLCFEVVIVALYWLLLAQAHADPVERYKNIQVHGIHLLFILLDTLLNCNVLPDRHCLIILMATAFYALWNWRSSVEYSKPVYPVLDWSGAGSAILVIGAIILAIIVFFAAQLVVWGRDAAAARWHSRQAAQQRAAAAQAAEEEEARWLQVFPTRFNDEPLLALPCNSCRCVCCFGGGSGGQVVSSSGKGDQAATAVAPAAAPAVPAEGATGASKAAPPPAEDAGVV